MENSLSRQLAIAAAAAAMLFANHASAYSLMQSVVSNTAMGVIDLTPEDGVAATFAVTQNYVSLEAILRVGEVNATGSGTNGGSAAVNYGSFSAALYDRPDSLSGTTQAWSALDGYDAVSYSAHNTLYITVGAHSMFTYGGDYSLWTYGDSVDNYRISAQLSIALGPDGQRANTWTRSGTSDFSDRFWLGYANNSDTEQRLVLRLHSTGSTAALDALPISPVAAVPEPSGYLMFAAGLGLLGWAARRGHRA